MSHTETDYKFFGRSDILNLLNRRVIDCREGYRQNIALLGNRYVGKSALLQHFIFNLEDENIITIYFDLENKDFDYFVRKYIGGLLFSYSKNQGLALYDDLHCLMESTKRKIPRTIEMVKKILANYESGKLRDAFLGLLSLPEVFCNESDKYCVLIMDEFQNIENFSINNAFSELGKKIMTQKKCLYLVSSSYAASAQKILTEGLSLLFGNFELLSIEPFDLNTSQQFIEENLQSYKIGAQLRNFLTDFTGGHPLYLRLITQEMINLCAIHKQNEVYMPLLTQSIENTIFDRWGVISRHCELMINDITLGKGNRIFAVMAMSLANGKHKFEELMEDVGCRKNQLKQKLSYLLEKGVVVKNGNFYYLKDKLFKYWIKYVYQKRVHDIDFTPDRQRKQFKDELNQCIEDFKLTSRKDFPSRIVDLLHCFEHETFDLNGRKYKLPEFTEIVPFKLRNDTGNYLDVIKASSEEIVWFIILKKETFQENDVNAVLKESKKLGLKPQKRLIISLTDLDENTRVKALQERFWIWNENELRTLLTLFDKPYIVR